MTPSRRRILLAAGALAAAPLARAQPQGQRTLGILSPYPRRPRRDWLRGPYATRLRELGWDESRNLVIVRPESPQREAALPMMAQELVGKKVDAIWAIGPEAAIAAARATSAIPIVFCSVPYPVEQGLIDSFARPGGNVTGVTWATGVEIVTAVLGIFRQIAPGVRRIALIRTTSSILTIRGEPYREPRLVLESAAQALGYDLLVQPVARREDFDPAFAAILASRAQGILCVGTTVTGRERHRIAQFALGNRLPGAFTQADFAEAGGLFSYGAHPVEPVVRSLHYVDRIFRGARPSDLPVERPSRYELVVNAKTAAVLGLSIPQAVLLRADRLIE